jgi:general secretion pathway protein E
VFPAWPNRSQGLRSTDQKNSPLANLEQLLTLGAGDREPDANDAHIVNIVDWLFQHAFEQRASDIHLEPRREQGLRAFSHRRCAA